MGGEECIAIILAIAAILLIWKLVRNENRNSKKLKPPQPPSWPIIGHLHLLKKKQPLHRTLFSLAERYGPVIHLQLGFRPALLISSSEHAKECLATNDRVFASRPSLLAGRHMGYDSKVLPWLPYDTYWRDLRKICTLHLLSAHRIESLRHIRVEEVSALVNSLFQASQQHVGTGNMKSRFSQLTFNIILRMVANKSTMDSEDAQRFKDLIDETFLLAGSFNLADYLPFLEWFDAQGLRAAMVTLQKKRDDFMQMLVNDHRQSRREREDLIDVLISTTDKHEILSQDNDTVVKASAIGMITAGTDTSSVTIEWALAALLCHPDILRKAQQELDTRIGRDRLIEESDLHKLTYLQAIIKETFRLYPAGPVLIPHESTEACNIRGFHVPAGTRLLVNVWAIQRDPVVWEPKVTSTPKPSVTPSTPIKSETSSQISTSVSQQKATLHRTVEAATPSRDTTSTSGEQNELEQAEEQLNNVDLLVSNLVIQHEVETVNTQIATLETQHKPVPDDLTDRKNALEIKQNLLVIQVQTGQLTMDKYLDQVRASIISCKKLALVFKKANKLEEAKKALGRSKIMEGEVKEVEEAIASGAIE